LAGLELTATLPFLGSRVVSTALWGGGTVGTGFQTISGNGLADVVSLTTAHGAALKVDWSIRPLAKTTVGAKVTGLWRTSTDVPAITGFSTSTTDAWIGPEAGVYGSWTPEDDLSLGWVGGIFLPSSSAFLSGTASTWLAVLTATLKL
jgi:hypothetical protein